MMILSFNGLESLKNIWLFISFILILAIIARKADDKSLNALQVPFLSSSKKAQKAFDRFVWTLIILYLILPLFFVKNII